MAEAAFLLDSNICIYILEGRLPWLRRRVEEFEPGLLVTSAIVFGEVMIGASKREATVEARRFFEVVPVLPFDERAGLAYARLPFKRGLYHLIAAHALALDLTLVTNNERDFGDIAGLRVENWTR
ncbi:type II toxin-antitoxin system VapC family toxin [Sphingomonas bacterium]|uniref:type II toxin-antitoxin system VapC family toxin n=1 Tax=Sphingomonas bacterium TaxID=1895847 RepID=UPI001575C087|nr:type II toxin-antitoxin system VapC family toxin [Sphingomonas bacterium]